MVRLYDALDETFKNHDVENHRLLARINALCPAVT
jgi:hypothetical protein